MFNNYKYVDFLLFFFVSHAEIALVYRKYTARLCVSTEISVTLISFRRIVTVFTGELILKKNFPVNNCMFGKLICSLLIF